MKNGLRNIPYNIHPSVTFTHKEEQSNSIPFLGIQLTTRVDGTLKGGINREFAVGQYTCFYSAVSIRYQTNLVKILTRHARMIYSNETIVNCSSNIHNLVSRNGYLTKLMNRHMNEMKRRPNLSTVPKKILFLKLQLLNDATQEIMTQRLRNEVRKHLVQPIRL